MKKVLWMLAFVWLLPATVSAGGVTLAWDYGDFAKIDGFRVYQDGVKVADVARPGPGADPATTWTTAALVDGQRYCWNVTAYKGDVESLPSNTVCVDYSEPVTVEVPGSPRRLILEFGK